MKNQSNCKVKRRESHQIGNQQSSVYILSIFTIFRDNHCIIERVSSKPKLLAWCSSVNNKISIAELETKESFANFDGVKLNLKDDGIF